MEKQLRRYKRRLKDHHRDRQAPIEATGAPSYILAGGSEERRGGAGDPAAGDRGRDGDEGAAAFGRRGRDADGTRGRAICLSSATTRMGGQRRPPQGRRQHRLDRSEKHPVGAEGRQGSSPSWSCRRSSASKACARRSKATSKKRLLQDLADMAESVYRLPSADRLQGADGPRGARPDRRRPRRRDPARPLPRRRAMSSACSSGWRSRSTSRRSTGSRSTWSSRCSPRSPPAPST